MDGRDNTGVGRGLTEKEAKARLKKYGPNAFKKAKKPGAAAIFLSQFKDILIIILLVSTLLSVLMGEFTEAAAIILIVMLNSVMGFVQEYRTEKTLDALTELASPEASVIRGGRVKKIPASQVVPGDVILLEAGDRIPADAELIAASGLESDESLLTGESLPAAKSTGDSVYMGAMVTGGRARAQVFATGMDTEMGRIAGMLGDIGGERTPLQRRLAELGKYIAAGCVAVCAAVSAAGILRGEPVFDMIVTGISLAVAAVPEGLPAIVTISLALGVGRMLKRNALVRKLTSVETLGCASVVCSDKTGTLTCNRMTVRRVYSGCGMTDMSKIAQAGARGKLPGDIRAVLETGMCCNNAEAEDSAGARRGAAKVTGDPTEAALLLAGICAGITPGEVKRKYTRTGELPFDPVRKCMSVTVLQGGGRRQLMLKGAPDAVLKKCVSVLRNGEVKPLTEAVKREIISANDAMADDGLRVLALACRDIASLWHAQSGQLESGLVFCGLEGMMDPPRPEAAPAVEKCRRAGIRVVMITGDHQRTAAAVARELGILTPGGRVVTGAQLDEMSDARLAVEASGISVFARVTPAHKLRIVKCLKSRGEVVAMTGDGVNDAPAVKEADIGVSMGLTGTDVTKEASSIILLDDNFASMVAAVEEGRVIYSNIRKFIRYMLSCNIGEVLTMFLGMLAGMPVVLLPIQILWVNLVTDGLPAIALSLEPPDGDVMDMPPRRADESIFSHGLLGTMIFRGAVIALSTLGVYVSVLRVSGILTHARSAAFLTLVLVQLVHVFECKSETKSLMHIDIFNNMRLVLAVLVSLAMMAAVLCLPALRPVFCTAALGPGELARVAAYTMAGPVLAGIFTRTRRKNGGAEKRRARGAREYRGA